MRSIPALVSLAFLTAGLAAQSSANMELLSRVPLPGCTTGDVHAIGDYMLLARRNEGWAVVNAKDPRNPVIKTILPPGYPTSRGNYGVGDIKSDGRYIYCSDEGRNQGVFIYDAGTDPMNPTYLGSLGPVGQVHNFSVQGNLLVTNSLQVWDITNRSAPVRIGSIPGGFAHDVLLEGNRAYVSHWGSGIGIYDMTNPRAPRSIASHNYANSATHSMWPTDDGKYLFTTDENQVGGVGGFVRVWDISNLAAITQVGQYKVGARDSVVHNVHVHGDLLFVSYYKEGVRVLSIKDPRNPVEIAHYDTFAPLGAGCFGGPYAGCWGVYCWDRNRVFVSDLDSGGWIFRLTTIPSTFTAKSLQVKAGTSADLSFAYRNATPASLDGFGILAITTVNRAPAILSLIGELKTLAPSQSVPHSLQIPVPLGVPTGTRVGFTAWSGHPAQLLVSTRTDLEITIQ